MRRPRGAGGRFLTATEVEEIERAKGDGSKEEDGSQETPIGMSSAAGGSDTK